jgi:tryptophanyl-tRNA synthetase
LQEVGGAQFSAFKKALAELCAAKLGPIAAETKRLMADPAEIDRILADGAERARSIAKPIIAEMKDVVGFVRS